MLLFTLVYRVVTSFDDEAAMKDGNVRACFEPKQDLVVPGALTQAVVERSPFWMQPEKLAAQV